MKDPMRESAITAAIMRYLRTIPKSVAYKIHCAPHDPQAGLPDIGFVIGGRAIFFEVKTLKGKLSQRQVEMIRSLRQAGAVAEVVRGVEDVKHVLQPEFKRAR